MSTAMTVVFWVSVGTLVYAWFGYLGCLAALATVRRRVVKRAAIRPMVSLIVPVHNGEGLIGRKIENLRALDYPRELVEIIIVDDCSIDGTQAAILGSSSEVRVVRLDRRSGKAAALNAALEIATGEIIGFTDVAGMLKPDALALAVERFADHRVGCVSSEDEIVSSAGVAGGESLYTRIDTLIRRYESAICSATGMNGSFYLVRRELCPPFPLDVATDMFSALCSVDAGARAVVEERSKVQLTAQPSASGEFERKVRTMVTGLRALLMFNRLLNPRRSGVYSLLLVSHKLLRYLTPLFVLSALGSAVVLSTASRPYLCAIWAMVFAAGIGMAHIAIQRYTPARSKSSVFSRMSGLMAFVCVSSAAASVAWFRYFGGKRYETWQPTERSAV